MVLKAYNLLSVAILSASQFTLALPATPSSFETSSSAIPVLKDSMTDRIPEQLNFTIPRSSCIRAFSRTPIFSISTFLWTVHVPGQMMPSTQGTGAWGGGFLDYLRAACGDISSWTAQPDGVKAPNTGIQTLFYNPVCTLKNVEDAAYAASDPNNRVHLHCEFPHGKGGVVPIDGGGGKDSGVVDA